MSFRNTGTTAKDVWDELKKLYEGYTTLILVDLGRQIQTTCCAEEDSVCDHFNYLSDLHEQLAAMSKSMPYSEFVLILMGSLPPSYQPTLSGIAAAAELSAMTPTVAVVTKHAVDEFDRRTLLKDGKAKDEAFAACSLKKGKRSDIECSNCKKCGHMKADCWAKGGDKEGQGLRKCRGGRGGGGSGGGDLAAGAVQSGSQQLSSSQPDIEVWAAIEEVEDEDEPRIPVMAADEAGGVQAELYDSGASHQMSPYCECFTMYQQISPHSITTANNCVFYAIGAGDLLINVPNGAESTKVTLCDVLHAPDMGLTVVSISRIVKSGCLVEFEDGSCKIKRGQKVVSQVPASANRLYKVEHALVTTLPEYVDILMLHRRLGHISVDAIRTLIRSNAITGIHLIDEFPPF